MATKDHTKFAEYRALARNDRPAYVHAGVKHEFDEPLIQAPENGSEMATFGNEAARVRLANVTVPQWLRRIKPLESALENINLEMGELKKLHGKKLHNLSFQTQQEDALVNSQTNKITRLIRDAKDEIKRLGTEEKLSTQSKHMRDNIQKALATRLQSIGDHFKREQLRYQSELRATVEPKKAPAPSLIDLGNEKPVGLDGDEEDDEDVASYDIGFNEQQQARAEDNRLRINQRMQEIRDIAQQVADIGEMFNDIANLISEQGSLLDRIDYNIESTEVSIVEGQKNLTEVAQGTKGFSKRLCLLLILILIFSVVVIIVIMTKRRK